MTKNLDSKGIKKVIIVKVVKLQTKPAETSANLTNIE